MVDNWDGKPPCFFEQGENLGRIHGHRPFCKHGASCCQLQALIKKQDDIHIKKMKKECPDRMQWARGDCLSWKRGTRARVREPQKIKCSVLTDLFACSVCWVGLVCLLAGWFCFLACFCWFCPLVFDAYFFSVYQASKQESRQESKQTSKEYKVTEYKKKHGLRIFWFCINCLDETTTTNEQQHTLDRWTQTSRCSLWWDGCWP